MSLTEKDKQSIDETLDKANMAVNQDDIGLPKYNRI